MILPVVRGGRVVVIFFDATQVQCAEVTTRSSVLLTLNLARMTQHWTTITRNIVLWMFEACVFIYSMIIFGRVGSYS